MSNTNPNDTKLEQQKSESQVASLENQAEGNYNEDTEAAAQNIADNLAEAKGKRAGAVP